jgi:hypothetical protein
MYMITKDDKPMKGFRNIKDWDTAVKKVKHVMMNTVLYGYGKFDIKPETATCK